VPAVDGRETAVQRKQAAQDTQDAIAYYPFAKDRNKPALGFIDALEAAYSQ